MPSPLPPDPTTTATPGEDLGYTGELGRKGLHLLTLLVPLGMAWFGRTTALLVLTPLAAMAVGADVLRSRSPAFHAWIDRRFGPLMRRSERAGPGGPVIVNGATWVLVSATLLTLLFPVRIGATALGTFMVADAAAALVGRRLGRHRWPGGLRTVEGSLAFVVAGLGVMTWLGVPAGTGAVAVVAGAAAEALPGPLNDNLRVPLVMAFLLFLLAPGP
ncbi:MAG: phosphatidate cytidylyltransferase [Rhodothermaceae bacterium]|nr:MAG: phosphatidate cytidylyltransferase [Rhodothermaceae bacterium]